MRHPYFIFLSTAMTLSITPWMWSQADTVFTPQNIPTPAIVAPMAPPPSPPMPVAPPAPTVLPTTPTTTAPVNTPPAVGPSSTTPNSNQPATPVKAMPPTQVSISSPTASVTTPSTKAAAAAPASTTAATTTTTSDTLSIVADVWCPYNCDPGTAQPGYMIEIVQAIFAKHKMKVDYKITPWSLSITEVTKGEKDAIIGVRKEEATTLLYPTQSLGEYILKAYDRTGDNFTYTTPDSLKGKTLGIVQDYSYGADLDSYITNTKEDKKLFIVSGEAPIATLVDNLLANKLDVFIDDANVTDYYLKLRNLQSKITPAGVVVTKDTQGAVITPKLYLGFSPNNPMSKQYAAWLDDGIAEMRKSGALAQILTRYGLQDWQPADVAAPSPVQPAPISPSISTKAATPAASK